MFLFWPSVCLSVRLSVPPSVRSTSVRPTVRTSFPVDTEVFINGFHSNFAYALVLKGLAWDCLMGKFR